MEEVRNVKGKLVCQIDQKNRVVEIVQKGCKTYIRFMADGTAEIINTN